MLQPCMYLQKWQPQGQFSRPSAVGMGISMTTLLTHTVAHSIKLSFRSKTNNQTLKKFLTLALSCTKVVKNWMSF